MNPAGIPDFVIIDDDYINNIICLKVLKIAFPEAIIRTFLDPGEGLEYLISTYSKSDSNNAMLFLDINMPFTTGWDVLDKYMNTPDGLREKIKIYILSSSVNQQDKEKSSRYAAVLDYLVKPLSLQYLDDILPRHRPGVL